MRNVERLKEYKAKLILFPRKGTKAKKGDADQATVKAMDETVVSGTVMPLKKPDAESLEFVTISQELQDKSVYATLRHDRNELKMSGIRERMKKDREAEKK